MFPKVSGSEGSKVVSRNLNVLQINQFIFFYVRFCLDFVSFVLKLTNLIFVIFLSFAINNTLNHQSIDEWVIISFYQQESSIYEILHDVSKFLFHYVGHLTL